MTTQEWFDKYLPDQQRPVSQGGIANAKHCARFYLYRHKWGIVPRVTKYSSSPKLGNIVHSMMQNGKDNTKVVQEQVMKSYNILMERIKKGEDLDGYLASEAAEIGELYNKALAICTIYWEKFPPKEYIQTHSRELVLESVYQPPVSNKEVPLIGIIDWLVEDSRNGSMWIRDFKTTGLSFVLKKTGIIFGLQGRYYRFLCKDTVSGFILDMIKTPSIKLCGKDHKTAKELDITAEEAYKIRVEEWYEVQEESMSSEAVAFLKEPVDNKELMTHLNHACHLWLAPCVPTNFMRDITLSKCTGYRTQCPYYCLCSSAESTWPAQIEQFFQIRTDNRTVEAKEKGIEDE
jgi:hypothetical protein